MLVTQGLSGLAERSSADMIPAHQARNLAGLFLERVRRTPNAVAYLRHDPASGAWVGDTWADTASQVGRWQEALAREGLAPGERVALMLPNRREWVWFDLAAAGLGLVTVPLFPNDRPGNILHCVADARPRLLLLESWAQLAGLAAAPELAETLAGLERILVLDAAGQRPASVPAGTLAVRDWLSDVFGSPRALECNPETLATIVYTSGTLGRPKGVMLSHRNILSNAESALRLIPAYPSDRFLSFLPLTHVLERTGGYYLAMMAGAAVAHARSVAQLAEDLRAVRPTVLIAVPRIFERVFARIQEGLATAPRLKRRLFGAAQAAGWHRFEYDQGRRPWSANLLGAPFLDRLVGAKVRARLGGRLRVAVCGGAPLAPDIARLFIALGVPVLQGYGLSEAAPVVSVNTLDDNRPDSVGVPLPGTDLRIGANRELQVRGPQVMLGYWGQPQASAAALTPDGWLHTGDQARLEAGHLYITGRIKDIIVMANGEKVPPADLEGAIALDEVFAQVLVIGEGRPYLAVLAVAEPAALARLAAAAGLDTGPPAAGGAAAPLDARLERLLLARIAARLKGFPAYAEIRRLALVAEPWSIEDGFMTATMKLRRARILSHYAEQVSGLYEGHLAPV
jgi:long-chain acyl-CoA synthetase